MPEGRRVGMNAEEKKRAMQERIAWYVRRIKEANQRFVDDSDFWPMNPEARMAAAVKIACAEGICDSIEGVMGCVEDVSRTIEAAGPNAEDRR